MKVKEVLKGPIFSNSLILMDLVPFFKASFASIFKILSKGAAIQHLLKSRSLVLFGSFFLFLATLNGTETSQYREMSIEELRDECERLESKRDTLVSAYKEIWKKHVEIQSELASRETEHTSLQSDYDGLKRRHKRLQLRLENMQKSHKERENRLKKEIDSLRKRLKRH
ncbi:MAG: hypothetical protein SNF33_06685 [Candidatus Algichlamydia australiensis]|nr:hypothetical protein [Chlamydiales bacterium]